MPVPFLGRLNLTEYTALVSSVFLVSLEAIIRILTLALPTSLLDLCYRASRRLANRFTSPAQKRAEERRKNISTSIRDAADFVELCGLFGYTAEEHVIQTKDGYLLGLHRLAWRPGEEDVRVNAGSTGRGSRSARSVTKPVVYLHHGLLMNSEVWVCVTDAQRSLPFVLVEHGFDVWLGNNRGNKYSKKAVHASAKSTAFWNFSMDEFALHDIPDSIAYVLETTRQPSLSYIGFSQGTAQAFAALAIHPALNDQVNVFIALAPAMSPAGLSNGIVDALVKASPQVLFLLFGRRSILSSAIMWQALLYPPLFVRAIDIGLSFLFGWQTVNVATSQKLAAYPHLYSFTSTKSVVHWFQIIRTKAFQMYDDDVYPLLSTQSKHTKVARYPTRNIRTPIVLVYGGSDSLVDIKAMLRELPTQTVATEIAHYEHLDFLWARDVDDLVFPHVLHALASFTGAENTQEEYARYRSTSHVQSDNKRTRGSDVTEAEVSAASLATAVRAVAPAPAPAPVARLARRRDSLELDDQMLYPPRTDLDLLLQDDDSGAEGEMDVPITASSRPLSPLTNASSIGFLAGSVGSVSSVGSVRSSRSTATSAATPGLRKTSSQTFRIAAGKDNSGGGIQLGSGRAVGGVVSTEVVTGSGSGSGRKPS